MASPCVTLLTDFGTADGYVGAMKGVLLELCPTARIVDLTHDVPAGDVRAGAFALATAAPFFAPGTVHLAVVDPGVGTGRRALVVEAAGAVFVGPDNGLLSLAARGSRRIYSLDRPEWFRYPTSATFHGRDVFAPVAARLASGLSLERLATPVEEMIEIRVPPPRRDGDSLVGEVIHIDRFGNLVTSLRAADLPHDRSSVVVSIGDHASIPVCETYGSAAAGTLIAVVGSSDCVEIAVTSGSAHDALGAVAKVGTPVTLRIES